jgi:hypothetical protein
MAGISYPRLHCAFGQLTTNEVNGTSQGGKIIVPGDATTNTQATITCTSVQANEYVVIDGITFTAKAATSQSARQFDQDAGDNATATALALCINGIYGVSGVKAVASTNVVTLTWGSTHPNAVTVVPSAATMVYVPATQPPGISATGRNQLTVVDAWIRAIGGACGGASCTGVNLATTAGVNIAVFLKAGITEGTVLRAGTATNGVSANLGLANAPGVGLKLQAKGADMETATALDYCVYFTIGKGQTAS